MAAQYSTNDAGRRKRVNHKIGDLPILNAALRAIVFCSGHSTSTSCIDGYRGPFFVFGVGAEDEMCMGSCIVELFLRGAESRSSPSKPRMVELGSLS